MGKQFTNKELEDLLNKKSKLKVFLSKNPQQVAKSEAEMKLSQIEEQVSKLCSDRNSKIVQEHIRSMKIGEGRFCQNGMRKQIMPQKPGPTNGKI